MKKIGFLLIASIMLSDLGSYTGTWGLGSNMYQSVISELVPEEAEEFLKDNYEDVLAVSYEYHDQMEGTDINDYQIGEPFVIYNVNGDIWDEVYYYPLAYEDEIMLIASVINTTDGWTISATDDYVDYLNQIGYWNNASYLFYMEDDDIISVSTSGKENLVGDIENCQVRTLDRSYDKEIYHELKQEIINQIDEMEPVDLKKITELNDKVFDETYTPSYSFNMTTGTNIGKICSLFSAQGQGNHQICWAASVATIVNYRLGTSHTATDVCDAMNRAYEGASIDVKRDALLHYGLLYTKTNSQLSWTSVFTNINAKYPIAVTAYDGDEGWHSMVVFGYLNKSGSRYVVMQNPGNKTTETLMYKTSGTVFTYNAKTWTWVKSLSHE